MPISLRDDGSVDVESVSGASELELKSWIANRLQGRDLVIPGGTTVDDDRHISIAIAFERLDIDHQRRMRRIVTRLIGERLSTKDAWTDDALAALFRLTELIVRDSSERTSAVRALISYLSNAPDTTATLRAVQALVAMDFKLQNQFWLTQYRGPAFGPIVLEALGKNDINDAFHFLQQIELSPRIEAALVMLVPTWLEQHGEQACLKAFSSVEAKLTTRVATIIKDFLGLKRPNTIEIFKNPERTHEPIARIRRRSGS